MSLTHRLTSPWLLPPMLLCILVVYLAGQWAVMDHYQGDLSILVCIGDERPAPELYQGRYMVEEDSAGYDGQYFLMIALDPFLSGPAKTCLDKPAYRYQRLFYPLLSRALALGQPEYLPLAMAGVNLTAVLLGSLIVGLFCLRRGLSPLWALAYGLSSGLFMSALRDLAEPLAMLLVTAGLLLHHLRKIAACVVCMALALLTKEVSALALAALVVTEVVRHRTWRNALLLCLAGVPLLAWWIVLYAELGQIAFLKGPGNLGLPLHGMWSYGRSILTSPGFSAIEMVYGMLTIVTLLGCLLLGALGSLRSLSAPVLALLLYGLFFACTTTEVWVEPWGYGRIVLPLLVVALVAFVTTGNRVYLPPVAASLVLFLLTLAWLASLA